ncbi:MAG: hypothetical protein ABEJ27_05050 [Halodesulfurarchaeum sp.]
MTDRRYFPRRSTSANPASAKAARRIGRANPRLSGQSTDYAVTVTGDRSAFRQGKLKTVT